MAHKIRNGKPFPGPSRNSDRHSLRRSAVLTALLMTIAAALMLAHSAMAQVVFSAKVNTQGGPATRLFRASSGTVTAIPTGLPVNEFALMSRNARSITFASPDPAQPGEASTDLFMHDLVTGQSRKLVDNDTVPQPDGSFLFASPMFSRASDSGQLVAFVNLLASSNNQGENGAIRQLNVVRGSDGLPLATAEIGQGNALDFYESEFVGISWLPQSAFFVTSAYVPVVTDTGRQTSGAGLVMYGPQGVGQYVRTQILTVPRVFEVYGQSLVAETHAYPAFAPDAQHLAFFRITYPSPLMTEPAFAELIVIDTNGNGAVLATFNPGFLPLGVAWSADASQLVFSIANQVQSGGQFPPITEPQTAVLLTINVNTGVIGSVTGAPNGYFPNVMVGGGIVFRNGFE